MTVFKKNDFLFKDIISLRGIGKKLSQYLKKKKLKKSMIYCGIYLTHILTEVR